MTLITGASSGIGRALALEFAGDKRSLIITGRDLNRLKTVEQECLARGAPNVFICQADLTNAEGIQNLVETIRNSQIRIDTLVNNAGIGVFGDFGSTDLQDEMNLVRLQIEAFLKLTKVFLPDLISSRNGRILNVGSLYCFAPVPGQAVYAACKAFMLSFSETLAFEVKDKGVRVTLVCPGSTATEFRSRAGILGTSGAPPEIIARKALQALKNQDFICIPGSLNQFFTLLMRYLPFGTRAKLMQIINQKRGVHRPNA